MELKPAENLSARAQKVGLSPTDWATEAGVARSTIFHVLRGRGSRGPHIGTLNRIVSVLESRELATLRHLIELHGVPAEDQAA